MGMDMRKGIFAAVMTLCLVAAQSAGAANMSFHDFEFTSIEGEPMPASGFDGKAVLVVNTASLCGFTKQYAGLQALWEQYRDKGLVVLGVPSNDFGGQEPGTETEIKDFCETNFGIDFPMTRKQHVQRPDAHPLYQWLKVELGTESVPRWNFHKYLIGRNGQAANYFASGVRPDSKTMREAIEAALAAKSGS
jgi:glutathione peroxidase